MAVCIGLGFRISLGMQVSPPRAAPIWEGPALPAALEWAALEWADLGVAAQGVVRHSQELVP